MGLKISKLYKTLILVFTKSLVNLKSLAYMVCSLLTFREVSMNAINPDALRKVAIAAQNSK